MTTASRSLATALWGARFASGLLRPSYTTSRDTTLSNGARAMVPPHISPGTRIVIQTEDGSYVERAKD